MRVWRDWAEQHWEAVGMATSITGALVIAVILAVVFNVISMRIDGPSHEVLNVEAPVSQAQSQVSDGDPSGVF